MTCIFIGYERLETFHSNFFNRQAALNIGIPARDTVNKQWRRLSKQTASRRRVASVAMELISKLEKDMMLLNQMASWERHTPTLACFMACLCGQQKTSDRSFAKDAIGTLKG